MTRRGSSSAMVLWNTASSCRIRCSPSCSTRNLSNSGGSSRPNSVRISRMITSDSVSPRNRLTSSRTTSTGYVASTPWQTRRSSWTRTSMTRAPVASCSYTDSDWHCAKGRVTNGMPILLVAESCVPGHTTWCTRTRSEPSSAIHRFRSAGRWSEPGNVSPDADSHVDSACFSLVTSLRRSTCFEKKAPMASSGLVPFLPELLLLEEAIINIGSGFEL
uniref:Uncharacterized protein n=1 Tax=Arundo donax TaxID=35708 RepID=A0A0A9F7G7_ARUDO